MASGHRRGLLAFGALACALAPITSSASAQDPIWKVLEDGVDDNFGNFTEWIGDVDHDGVRDLLAASLDSFGLDTVRLLSGRDGATLHEFTGGASSLFGLATSDVGDADADGTPDFAILDGFADGSDSDNVSVFSGATFELLFDYSPRRNAWDLAPLGDVDQDGHDDFVVGVPGVLDHGAVRWISGLDGSVLFRRPGDPGDRLGACVARVSDVDNDGFPDVAAGSPIAGGTSYIRFLSGRDGATLFDVVQPAGFEEFGRFFRVLGDHDGDGVADLIVASTLAESSPGRRDGAFAIVSGADGSLLHLQFGSAQDEFLGTVGAALGDVNGDGDADFALGTIEHVDVVSGRTLQLLHRFPTLVNVASHTPDVDGDGIVDVTIGRDAHGIAGEVETRTGNDLWLRGEPDLAAGGDLVTFTTLENDPGLLTIRVLVEVDGTPLFLPLPPFGTFGADRQRVESFVLPPGLGAHHLVYVALAQKSARGGLRISGQETLDLE